MVSVHSTRSRRTLSSPRLKVCHCLSANADLGLLITQPLSRLCSHRRRPPPSFRFFFPFSGRPAGGLEVGLANPYVSYPVGVVGGLILFPGECWLDQLLRRAGVGAPLSCAPPGAGVEAPLSCAPPGRITCSAMIPLLCLATLPATPL